MRCAHATRTRTLCNAYYTRFVPLNAYAMRCLLPKMPTPRDAYSPRRPLPALLTAQCLLPTTPSLCDACSMRCLLYATPALCDACSMLCLLHVMPKERGAGRSGTRRSGSSCRSCRREALLAQARVVARSEAKSGDMRSHHMMWYHFGSCGSAPQGIHGPAWLL